MARLHEESEHDPDSPGPGKLPGASAQKEEVERGTNKACAPSAGSSREWPQTPAPSRPAVIEQIPTIKPVEQAVERKRAPSPRKAIARRPDHCGSSDSETHGASGPAAESDVDDLSDFVVGDSASEDELRRPPRSQRKTGLRSPRKLYRRASPQKKACADESDTDADVMVCKPRRDEELIDLTSPCKPTRNENGESQEPRQAQERDAGLDLADELDMILRLSPPTEQSPTKREPGLRPQTPPASPIRAARLKSPTKNRAAIPPSPHRPSIDAFWQADVINEWNDAYSPTKNPLSKRLFPAPEASSIPAPSPAGLAPSPDKGPPKRSKAAADARKQFEAAKQTIADAFLAELDERVTQKQLAGLSASTGGVRVTWSNKLQSTAGRASWRREQIRRPSGCRETRHFASIELASKVIDSEERLLSTLAHEFCHLANFMVSGVKDRPHGAEFKAWARKVGEVFGESRGLVVTTKHSYEIEYKYVWQCAGPGCGQEYKRHSKSVDVDRQTCGRCKARLVQTKPAPRAKPADGEQRADAYQAFVKMQFARVKEELAREGKTGIGNVMAALAKEWREKKGGRCGACEDGKTLRKERKGEDVLEVEVVEADEEVDAVVKGSVQGQMVTNVATDLEGLTLTTDE